ncbi:hypothetical protein ACI7YT_02095 [Microbacterium sp. M]|uniref:hypothetical protein n=1 Tax=Microbacterium sp. M TaxID=3377125 RepID=UPI00386B048D
MTTSKIGRVLGYDGAVATLLLTVFQYFLASASFVACLMPALVFQALVGWQLTHLALWLGAVSLLPLAPALQALVVAADRLLTRGASAQAWRVFWRSFADAVRTRWASALAVVAGVLVLGYDVALLGADAGVLLVGAALAAVAAVVLLSSIFLVAEGTELRGVVLAVAAGRAALLRPHLALTWLLLAGIAVFATTLPVVGAVAWFSAPSLAAAGAVICNRTLGLASAHERVGA